MIPASSPAFGWGVIGDICPVFNARKSYEFFSRVLVLNWLTLFQLHLNHPSLKCKSVSFLNMGGGISWTQSVPAYPSWCDRWTCSTWPRRHRLPTLRKPYSSRRTSLRRVWPSGSCGYSCAVCRWSLSERSGRHWNGGEGGSEGWNDSGFHVWVFIAVI